MVAKFLLIAALVALASASSAYTGDCSYTTSNGTTWDYSSLITSNAAGFKIPGSGPWADWTFFIQLCGNVMTPPSGCSAPEGGAAGYMVATGNDTCWYIGQSQLSAWNEDPSGNGAFLTYFNGQLVNNVENYSFRIYFECDYDTPVGAPAFEHMTDFDQFHFHWFTKVSCR